ncbi:hypothetical protein WICMUC_003057 [Wickerhamomyces mucosus]|uniref:SH3 domain-containing protein n=1 Tax=Wickerhamomyces mucosus TaxID=1378264 RepID=A0A9P8TDL6_9ASCO|nr:hypothetical protein WICMUC_003057 [Wickerhamomyces mucosus]
MVSERLPFKTQALYPYSSDFEDDLNFAAGQIIEVTSIEDEQWFSGSFTDSNGVLQSGMFPRNFVGEAIPELVGSTAEPHEELQEAPESPNKGLVETRTPEEAESEEQYEGDNSSDNKDRPNFQSANNKRTTQEDPAFATVEPESTKQLPSKVSSFSTQSSVPLPSSKISEVSHFTKSYKGVPSSYIPPSIGKSNNPVKTKPDHHSSYIPPKFGKPDNSSKEPALQIPKEAIEFSNDQNPEEDLQIPKLSLKDRIALLQKQQKEEAEKQAALLKKKQQKLQENSVKPENFDSNNRIDPSLVGPPTEPEKDVTDHQNDETDDSEILNRSRNHDDERENVPISKDVHYDENDTQNESFSEVKEDAEVRDEEREKKDQEEDADEEEDEEEARRAILTARMAKLAGAGGLYGASGFNPFGNVPKLARPPKRKGDHKDEDEDKNHSSAAPVPIFPYLPGTTPEFPVELQKAQEEYSEETLERTSNLSSTTGGDFQKQNNEGIENEKDYGYDPAEEYKNSNDIGDSSTDATASLADKLDHLNLKTATVKTLQSESAIEGDDERERDSSEDDLTFSDPEKLGSNVDLEKHEATETDTFHTVPGEQKIANIVSDYTTGYESDDDIQFAINSNSDGNNPREISHPDILPPGTSAPTAPTAPSLLQIEDDAYDKAVIPSISSVSSANSSTKTESPLDDSPLATFNEEVKHSSPTSVKSVSFSQAPITNTLDLVDNSIIQEATSGFQKPAVPDAPVPTIPQDAASTIPQVSASSYSFKDSSPPMPPPIPSNTTGGSLLPQVNEPPLITGVKKSATFSHNSVPAPSPSTYGSLESKYNISSGWWLSDNQLPHQLQLKVGKELIYEMDKTIVDRRGGKKLVLKDYYILHQDNSQTILNISFAPDDPEKTIEIKQDVIKSPKVPLDKLDQFSDRFGTQVFQISSKLVNVHLKEPLVPYVLSQIKNILPPVGLRSYGVVIYTNSNNTEVHQDANFRAGDIIAINRAKFHGHNKLRQKIVYDVGNTGSPFAAIITEFDDEKKKFRVIEQDSNGKIRHSSYKPSDMKSGKIKVFRVVGREFVGW